MEIFRCMSCSSTGRIVCSHCRGHGKLRWFLQLTVTFHNNCDDYIKKSGNDIPDKLLRSCLTKNVFSEKNQRVNIRFGQFFLLKRLLKTLTKRCLQLHIMLITM